MGNRLGIKKECVGCDEEKTCPEAKRPPRKGKFRENVDCYKPNDENWDDSPGDWDTDY